MGWLSRTRRGFKPPPEPNADEIRRAREKLAQADAELERTEAREREVTQRGEHLEEIRKVNHIGPAFWDAMQIQRRRKA